MARAAFTLVELLVVIGIAVLLMALSVASVVRGPALTRIAAAEQLVADAIRQARHAARTGGQPLVLLLDPEREALSGLARSVLWTGEEHWPPAHDSLWPGLSGQGLLLPDAYAGDAEAVLTAIMDGSGLLEGPRRLARGLPPERQQELPRLLLSVAVRPPPPERGPELLPLVAVGFEPEPAESPDAFGRLDDSILGLALVRSDVTAGSLGGGRPRTVTPAWEALGWLVDGSGAMLEISSLDDASGGPQGQRVVLVRGDATAATIMGDAHAGAFGGGQWLELALLVEPGQLLLYRDGREIARREATAPGADGKPIPVTSLRSDPARAERIVVGLLRHPAWPPERTRAPAGSTWLIDSVRLERLGGAPLATLPDGVRVAEAVRIRCHPDGRVEASGPIRLVSATGEQAELTVSAAGTLSSRIATQGSAP